MIPSWDCGLLEDNWGITSTSVGRVASVSYGGT
jgi:hypothetical protein